MSDSVMLTGKQIPIARLMALLKGMGLEEKGLKVGRGRSCMAIVKSEFGWKGNRRKIMTLLADHIEYLNRKYVASYLFPDDADDEYKEAGEIIEWAYPASNEWTDDQVFEEFCKVVDRGDRIKREHFIARDTHVEDQLFQEHLDQCGACPRCEAYEEEHSPLNDALRDEQ